MGKLPDNPMNWDKYGHCVLCHKNMLIEQVIGGKVEKRFTPDYAESEYLLNDGSKMRVAICKQCKSTLDGNEYKDVMQCVYNGWEKEVNAMTHWNEEKKVKHLARYKHKSIVINSENVPDDSLKKKLKEFKNKEK